MATMTKLPLFAAVTMVTVHLTFCQNYDEWIKTQHEIGGEVLLNCSEYPSHPRQEIPEQFTEVRSWMGPAPNLYVWNVDASQFTNISEAECPTCEILEDGWKFRIKHFDPAIHIGIYHCMLYDNNTGTYYLVKWGVNMRGPYFEDLLEKYEQNIIIGISAFGGFMVVAIAIMLTYKFRWIPDGTDGQRTTLATSHNNYGTNIVLETGAVYNNVMDGKVNPAFTPDKDVIYRNVESPPAYNGVKAEVQVHEHEPRPSTSSSSSSSEGGSVRKRETERDVPHPPTPHHTVTQGFNFGEEQTTHL